MPSFRLTPNECTWSRWPDDRAQPALARRARIVLACAAGNNKIVARRLSLSSPTVGKCRAPRAGPARRVAGRATTGSATNRYRRAGRTGGHRHLGDDSARRHALERPVAYSRDPSEPHDHQSHLPPSDCVPIGARPSSCRPTRADGKGPGHRRPLCRSARPCRGAVRRREIPDSAPRLHRPVAADATRASPTAHARLSAPRHHVAFAALDLKTRMVTSDTHRRHRAIEFRKFLDRVDVSAPSDLAVHIIMGNYGTHKTLLICSWFAKRSQFHVHFTPTHGSQLNPH